MNILEDAEMKFGGCGGCLTHVLKILFGWEIIVCFISLCLEYISLTRLAIRAFKFQENKLFVVRQVIINRVKHNLVSPSGDICRVVGWIGKAPELAFQGCRFEKLRPA
jgi:uncharacterized membrane protein YtjA (UPF0391 family)